MRLNEALFAGAICCVLAVGCRMGYEDAVSAIRGAGSAAGSSGASGGAAANGGSGATGGTTQPAGAGDTATPTDGGATGTGGDNTSAGGSANGATGGTDVIGASGDTSTGGTPSAGGMTASGGVSGSAAADAGGAAGDTNGGSSATGGTSAAGGTGGSSGAGGGGGYAGASSLGDCTPATYGSHDYLFCNVKVTWAQARDNCASIGMALVRVDDTGEDQFISDNGYASPPITGIWLGATDGAVEGEWRWVDGELFWLGGKTGSAQNGLYEGWYPGIQPTAQQPQRDCAVHDIGSSPGWYDSDCAFSKEYVCESL
ncbi:MAG TPA: C-type lectin domain-containing protein [Polyangiaceae bacterium]|nr:C-type lectin domain-containing protein [Polyangiaceae bacterium]